ncbi:histone-like nucleoid-structuring protein Lsr2 [Streptomyces sp. NPDC021098]|uniref:Lsr2 family DNA-binding protein n=1 Tax=unclassified Streptomyces TaxID=2593676 RepID=UPI003795517A
MNAIDALVQLCPPPADPPRPIDWGAVEDTLGMRLPADYKRLASVYGPGDFADFVSICHPHGYTEYSNLTGRMPGIIREYVQRDYDQGKAPVPCHPRHLFTMGGTDNGDDLFWITDPQDAPDTWRITVSVDRGFGWFTFDGTLTEFLFSVLSGETVVPQFPDGLLEGQVAFKRSAPTPWVAVDVRARPPVDTASIREWGRARGYEVPSRGRVPREVLAAWEEAHPYPPGS